MKALLIILSVIILLNYSANSQNKSSSSIPAEVASAFKAKFPSAAKVNWEMEKKTEYEVHFKQNGVSMSAIFDKKGKWLETETTIKIDALPPSVLTTLGQNFKGYKINEACKIDSEKDGKCFETEIEKGELAYEVLFSSDGKVIHKTKIEGNKEEKESQSD